MLTQEIIRRKRDGQVLEEAEIAFMVRGLSDGSISEGQVAAFAMAVFFRGMTMEERVVLTREMTQSGITLDWSDLRLGGPVLDKHSTGGVGDKVSLMLAPVVAACGGFVPMISGRGLGHTGGTLDKLESIPGYLTTPDRELFRRTVAGAGCAIIGQTDDLAPADRRFYAIRDVTATVESIPLITASILSKKLAAGLDGLVMDVKTGSGAFAASMERAEELAESIVAVARGAGLPTTALITDMDQVLGRSIGNGVEVAEAVAYLRGDRDERLHEVVMALASEMLVLGGLAETAGQARQRADDALTGGSAAQCFAKMVAGLGGPADLVENSEHYLQAAPVIRPCPPPRPGRVQAVDTRAVGVAVVNLGGGRTRADQAIDHRVGFTDFCAPGETVGPDRPLAVIHAANEASAEAAIADLQKAMRIGDDSEVAAGDVVHKRIAGDGR